MIQDKELRIGNLYNTIRNVEVTVKGFDTLNKFVVTDARSEDLDITVKNVNSIIFEDLNPIELKDFTFSRLGFNAENSIPLNPTFEKGARFIWVDEKKHVVLTDGNQDIVGIPLRYVHQFQNMYYLMTGKELTFS